MEASLGELVRAAAQGDGASWNAIVDRFQGLVWATARAHRLSQADAADVAQTTWLRLVENLDRIRDPERLGGWLATTARHECLRHIRLHGRELPSDQTDVFDAAATSRRSSGCSKASGTARCGARSRKLSDVCQALLRLLVAEDEPSYETISAALGMPIGSIGPTRMRCLAKLRAGIELDPAFEGGAP